MKLLVTAHQVALGGRSAARSKGRYSTTGKSGLGACTFQSLGTSLPSGPRREEPRWSSPSNRQKTRLIPTDGSNPKPGDGEVLAVEIFQGLLLLVFLKERIQSREISSLSRLFSEIKQSKHSRAFGVDSSKRESNPGVSDCEL